MIQIHFVLKQNEPNLSADRQVFKKIST